MCAEAETLLVVGNDVIPLLGVNIKVENKMYVVCEEQMYFLTLCAFSVQRITYILFFNF